MAWTALAAVAVVLVGCVLLCVARARRLDRLHVRTDGARAGLQAALDRRIEVALRVSAALAGNGSAGLVPAARAARAAGPDREAAENTLSRHLAAVDRSVLDDALFADLADAEQLVILARRVHNDAVRDTRALRSRRLVRWLRLAGRTPIPAYFEIADPEPGARASADPASGVDVRSAGHRSAN